MATRRKAAKESPDAPDLPPRFDDPPAALEPHERVECVRVRAQWDVAERVDGAEVRESVLADLDLSGRVLAGFGARDVRFERCDLSGTVLDSASLQRVEFVGCRMMGTVLSGASLSDVQITECRADLANFRMAKARYLLVERTSLREGEFYRADFEHSSLLDCELTGANFADASLTAVDLHGCGLEQLRGAASLGGAAISADQIVPLAASLLADTGITVTDAPRLRS